jgi:hypothetical protein
VISNFRPVDKSIKDAQGRRYQLKILPYRTVENKMDGAVITIIALSPESASRAS